MGNPPVMLLDLRPITYPMLVICNHEVAEQLTRQSARWSSSTPKSPTLSDIRYLTGTNSILTAEVCLLLPKSTLKEPSLTTPLPPPPQQGEHWKVQRRRLNPGFAPQHLLTTLPTILDKARFFLGHLDRHAAASAAGDAEAFSLDELCTNLTFDIIGAVTMGLDLKAQVPGQQSELLTLFVGISAQYKGRDGPSLPLVHWRKDIRRWRLARKIEVLMKDVVRAEHARVTSSSSSSSPSSAVVRNVLGLSLQGTQDLTPELLQQTSDNLRVFMFAGHDTTSILMQWAIYELTRSPRARAALHAELDALFGADDVDPRAIGDRLLAPGGPELLAQMTYATAVIKETLRLHPPAASVRMTSPGTDFKLVLPPDEKNNKGGQPREICTDGTIMYLNAFIIQRDRAVWGDTADDFVPERWLGDTSWMPAGAWRPFERGPRSCIGLELANIEVKVILALVARRYDFVKVGIGELDLDAEGRPMLDEKGSYKTKSTLFNVSFFFFFPSSVILSPPCLFSRDVSC